MYVWVRPLSTTGNIPYGQLSEPVDSNISVHTKLYVPSTLVYDVALSLCTFTPNVPATILCASKSFRFRTTHISTLRLSRFTVQFGATVSLLDTVQPICLLVRCTDRLGAHSTNLYSSSHLLHCTTKLDCSTLVQCPGHLPHDTLYSRMTKFLYAGLLYIFIVPLSSSAYHRTPIYCTIQCAAVRYMVVQNSDCIRL